MSQSLVSTLTTYKKLTGKDLVDDPLSAEIKSCDSPTGIHGVFERHAQAFGDPIILKTRLRAVIDKLQALSSALSTTSPQAVGIFKYTVCVTNLKYSAL
jgi:hypothetical protein